MFDSAYHQIFSYLCQDILTIWTVVECYAGIKLVELNGKKINEARNTLTATEHAHTRFGNLEICVVSSRTLTPNFFSWLGLLSLTT